MGQIKNIKLHIVTDIKVEMAFSFGATAAAPTAVAPQPGGFSFGGLGGSAASTAATSGTSVAGFSFGGLGSASATSATTSSTGTFSFGGAATAPTLGVTSAAAPKFSLGGGLGATASAASASTVPSFSFGAAAQPAATSQPAATVGAATPAFNFAAAKPATIASVAPQTNASSGFALPSSGASAFSFGAASSSSASTSSASTTTVASVLPTLSFSGGASSVAASSSATSVAAPAASGLTFKAGALAASTSAKTSTSVTTSTATSLGGLGSVSAPAKQMSYKELEDTVDKWLHDLAEQEKAFLNQATQVNTWDKQLIENGEKVTELNNEVERLKADQQRLDRELDFILSQQEELEELLQPIEAQVKSQQVVQHVQHSDVERERTYNLADNIDAQLKRMMEDLREIIERINNSNVNPVQGGDEAMASIGKILNSHMDSLQWVDQSTNQLQKRLEDVSSVMESRKVEQEKTFHLSYDRD